METMYALEMYSLLAYVCIILIWPSKGFETWDLVFSLNSDGSLNSSSKTPNCGRDSGIDFISYTYLQKQCHYSDGCHTVHEESLSPAAEVLIHKMCSWKEECNNLSFPLRSIEQTTNTNAINLKFRCVDNRTKRINICANGVTHFNNAVYLTSYDNATLYEECYCFVDKGNFSMTISDLRLVRTTDNQCSPAVLLINSNEFACDAKRDGFGSVFHRQIIQSSKDAYISWKRNSRTISPEMIVLTLTPEETARISCEGIRTEPGILPATTITDTTIEVSTTQSYTTPSSILYISSKPATNGEEKKYDSCSTQFSLIFVLAVWLVLSLVANVYWYKTAKKSSEEIRKCNDGVNLSKHTVEYTNDKTEGDNLMNNCEGFQDVREDRNNTRDVISLGSNVSKVRKKVSLPKPDLPATI